MNKHIYIFYFIILIISCSIGPKSAPNWVNIQPVSINADGAVSIYDTKTRKELYQKSRNNVMGVSFTSFEDAGKDALIKMVNKLDENIFHEIIFGLDSN